MILNLDYERQIYVGLSTDDWGDVEFKAGDVAYIMDQSKCWIFDGSTMQQLPDLGGGGDLPTWSVTLNSSAAFTINVCGVYLDDHSGLGNRGLSANTSKTYDMPPWTGGINGSYGYPLQLRYPNNKNTTIAAAPNNEFVVSDEYTSGSIHFRLVYIKVDNAVINIT